MICVLGSYRSVPNSPTRSHSVPFMSYENAHQYPTQYRYSQARYRQGKKYTLIFMTCNVDTD